MTSTETKLQHTPLPHLSWDEPSNWRGLSIRIHNDKFEPVAVISVPGWGKRKSRAYAEQIVQACNSFYAMRDALEKISHIDWCVGYELTESQHVQLQEAMDLSRASLAIAKGEQAK